MLRDVNGNTYNRSDAVAYYLDAAVVNSFTSQWASWGNGANPVGVRSFPIGIDSNGVTMTQTALGIGGIVDIGGSIGNYFDAGISWIANVSAPAFIGGGQIAYNQLVNREHQRYIGITPIEVASTYGQSMVDVEFPYCSSVPVETILVAHDSPNIGLQRSSSTYPYSDYFNKYSSNFAASTYLIYKPIGDSIWVPLSVINWGYNATAIYNETTQLWEMTSGSTNGGGNGISILNLPEWNDNTANHNQWVRII